MGKMIPLSIPNFSGNEEKYVGKAVRDGWVSTGGEYITEFENVIAAYCGAKGAVACQSGTAGLHTAMMLMGITREDAVFAPTLTFIAAVNPIAYIGAKPIFMDCDDCLCMDPAKLREYCETKCTMEGGRLIDNESGRHIKAIVVVHVFGDLANMEAIMDIAEEFRLKVVEDATEALGTYCTEGRYAGKHAGTIGDVGVYSFNGNKVITTGGGGMIVSERIELLEHAKHLTTQAKADPLYYIHDEIGYNYRMTNVQAALGVAQMEELDGFLETKKRNFERYEKGIAQIEGLRLLKRRQGIASNYWFYALVCEEGYRYDRDRLIQYLAENDVQSRPIWGLICDQKPYVGSSSYRVEKARYYYKHIVNIPCSTNLTDRDVDAVLNLLGR